MDIEIAADLLAKRSEILILEDPKKKNDLRGSYSIARATPDNLDRLGAALRAINKDDADFTEESKAIVDALLAIDLQWTLTRNGEPVPITSQGLREVPNVILSATFMAVMGDARPPEHTQPS